MDLAIQEAIWSLTNNSSLSGGFYTITGNDSDDTTDQYWIHQALENYAGVNLRTGPWFPGLPTAVGNLSLQANKQTFLVQVAPTPEPRFYGFLIVAMAGMGFFVARRSNSPRLKGNHSGCINLVLPYPGSASNHQDAWPVKSLRSREAKVAATFGGFSGYA